MCKSTLLIFASALFVLHFLAANAAPKLPIQSRVVKGIPQSISNNPFVVSLKSLQKTEGNVLYYTVGTGSLISNKCVLTAAHVVKDSPNGIEVCGGSEVYQEGNCRNVEKFMTLGDIDLAVVVLREPLQGANIRPIELDFNKVATDAWVRYVGFGSIENRYGGKRSLSVANFQVEPENRCDKAAMFCYRDRSGRQNIEGGDSGGPVIHRNKQVAVTTANVFVGGAYRNSIGVPLSNAAVKNFVLDEFKRNC